MYKLVNFCEIDEAAEKAYCAIHNVSAEKNLKDVTKVDFTSLPPVTMLFGGSPCQDFSLAGRQEGVRCTCNVCGCVYNPMEYTVSERKQCPECRSEDISRTRSSLLQYFIDALLVTRPKVAVYENVEMLLTSKFNTVLRQFQYDLEEAGYFYETVCLNCEDFGIPQHRKRVFIVFMRSDCAVAFTQFIDTKRLRKKYKLGDYLDLTDSKHIHCSDFVASRFQMLDSTFTKIYCGTTLGEHNTRFGTRDKVCHERGQVCTLTASDYKQPRTVLINTEKYYGRPNGHTDVFASDLLLLNEKEMFRLMGFADDDFQKVKDTGISRVSMYRIAGNSIAVNVLFYLYKALYMANRTLFDDISVLSLFSGAGAFEKALTLFMQELSAVGTDNVETVEFPFEKNIKKAVCG